MDNYYGFLDDVRQSFTDGEQMKISKKFNFLTEDLKMLSYKQNNVTNVVAKKIDNTEVDIKKLMKFTKRSKLNQSDNERTNSDTLDNTPIINAFDFKNTIGVVKNEVKNGLQLERLINQKRQKLEEVFKNMELPDIEDYESKTYSPNC